LCQFQTKSLLQDKQTNLICYCTKPASLSSAGAARLAVTTPKGHNFHNKEEEKWKERERERYENCCRIITYQKSTRASPTPVTNEFNDKLFKVSSAETSSGLGVVSAFKGAAGIVRLSLRPGAHILVPAAITIRRAMHVWRESARGTR